MKKELKNIAYIDGANLYKGITDEHKWKLDYNKFRIWLTEKYATKKAYIFIGMIPKNKELYTFLQEAGFTLIFKEVIYDGNGSVKGNCDADLVVKTMKDFYENKFDKAVIVSSDGDYSSLIKLLNEKNKLEIILSPSDKCSILLKRINVPISYVNDKRNILEYVNKKAPDTDGTV